MPNKGHPKINAKKVIERRRQQKLKRIDLGPPLAIIAFWTNGEGFREGSLERNQIGDISLTRRAPWSALAERGRLSTSAKKTIEFSREKRAKTI